MGSLRNVPEGERLPDNLGRVMAIIGVVSFVIYLLTLATGVYPGVSASWVSSAMGFRSWESASHPIWRLFVFLWQQMPLGGTEIWRLNLSSAVCGAVATALLCRYAACWVFSRLRVQTEERSYAIGKITDKAELDQKEIRTFSRVAVSAGVCAALLFATGLAGWGAATRFRPEAFDIVLVLAAFLLYQDYTRVRGVWHLYALALVCGAGIAETVLFWVATPFLVLSLIAFLYRHHRLRFGLCAGLFAMGLLGLGLYVLAAGIFTQAVVGTAEGATADWQPVLRQLLKLQLKEVQLFLPHKGWMWVLILLVLPWDAFQVGYWEHLHRKRDLRADVFHISCLVMVFVLHFGIPIPPWPLWRFADRLPMLEAAIVALLGGWVCAYWVYGLLVRWESDKLLTDSEIKLLEKRIRQKRWLSLGVCSALITLTILAVLTNGTQACGQRSTFADICAKEILDHMNGRTWLVTDGTLDPNLAALAAAEGRTLHLLDLTRDRDEEQMCRLRTWLQEDTQLEPYQDTLLPSTGLGVGSFLREWLAIDPQVEDALAFYVMPNIWHAAGITSRPDGFLFQGVRSQDELRHLPLLDEQRPFWERMRVLLPAVEKVRDPVDMLRWSLRGHLSMVANDLGVLLLDLERNEDAFDAFDESLQLEPKNLSALGNQVVLTEKGLRPAEKDRIEHKFKQMTAEFNRKPLIFDVVRRYGQIRSIEALAGVGAVWSRLGQYGLAKADLRRAVALAENDKQRNAILACLGRVNVTAGEISEGEDVFRSLLDKEPGNIAAIMGMLNVTLRRGNDVEARKWLARARKAGGNDLMLAFSEAQADVVSGNYNAARERLLDLTDKEPKNLDAWLLLATAMIHLQQLDDVERVVLPKMEGIVYRQPNALVYQVRGDLACARGSDSFGTARNEYRRALRMSPGRRDLLERVIDLDLRLQDQSAAGRDAVDLLRMDGDNATAHFVLGTQAIIRDDLDAAESHLRASVAGGGNLEALNNLAELLVMQGELAEAEKFARQAVAKSEGNTAVLDTLAGVLLRRGSIDEAVKVIDQARSLAPEDWALGFTQARIFMATGRKEEARVLLSEVRNNLDSLPAHSRIEVARVAQEWKSQR